MGRELPAKRALQHLALAGVVPRVAAVAAAAALLPQLCLKLPHPSPLGVYLIMNALSQRGVAHRHAKNINSDTWRRQQLLRSTSRPGHPFNSFSTGNVDTLLHQPKVS